MSTPGPPPGLPPGPIRGPTAGPTARPTPGPKPSAPMPTEPIWNPLGRRGRALTLTNPADPTHTRTRTAASATGGALVGVAMTVAKRMCEDILLGLLCPLVRLARRAVKSVAVALGTPCTPIPTRSRSTTIMPCAERSAACALALSGTPRYCAPSEASLALEASRSRNKKRAGLRTGAAPLPGDASIAASEGPCPRRTSDHKRRSRLVKMWGGGIPRGNYQRATQVQ